MCASGQLALDFSVGVAGTLAFLGTDVETRIAGLMFELTLLDTEQAAVIEPRFGAEVGDLVAGVRQLIRLRELTQAQGLRVAARAGAGAMPRSLRWRRWKPCARCCWRWPPTCAWCWCGWLRA